MSWLVLLSMMDMLFMLSIHASEPNWAEVLVTLPVITTCDKGFHEFMNDPV